MVAGDNIFQIYGVIKEHIQNPDCKNSNMSTKRNKNFEAGFIQFSGFCSGKFMKISTYLIIQWHKFKTPFAIINVINQLGDIYYLFFFTWVVLP